MKIPTPPPFSNFAEPPFQRNDMVDLHMSSLGSIVPQFPCCVFYATRRHHTHIHTHTYTRTQHAQGLID